MEDPWVSTEARIPAGNADSGAVVVGPALSDSDRVSWEMLVGALILLVGSVLVVPLSASLVLQARKGPKWVRANVHVVAQGAPAVSVELTS